MDKIEMSRPKIMFYRYATASPILLQIPPISEQRKVPNVETTMLIYPYCFFFPFGMRTSQYSAKEAMMLTPI